MEWFDAIAARARPASGEVALNAPQLTIVLLLALIVVITPPVWQVVRLGVTLVHELGHAGVGIVAGRQFTGFVLRGDMSGHAVTRGPSRGPGRIVSTWSGYPMPALLGAGVVWAALRGWSAPVITAMIVILLFALIRVRSALTVLVVLAALSWLGALWWWRSDTLQPQVLLGLGCVLLVGAWRHLSAVLGDHSSGSDPGVLAALSHLPRAVWNASFVLVCAAATWVVAVEVLHALR
ncbi:M50 family metallopeptidase [Humibacillus xanthopallidus]|uniref:Peptidase M50B-like protein n=1 Tax=Humibacillus xanthopallidus TaxID=412689 RepID=A0A543I3N7_9MICO|nr:M50 family metallopeptidase [Humibacillus xanthopallidus]TQM55068.1 peptidase M50B-like protein [Humibacillus xanthopallidus]TQM65204.1 peptidase M50B-like protein [Humibacillus xanthopallidus]